MMNKIHAISASLATALVFSSNAWSTTTQSDWQTDLIYGTADIGTSSYQPYVNQGPTQNDKGSYVLFNHEQYVPAQPFQAPVRLADDRQMLNDVMYGM